MFTLLVFVICLIFGDDGDENSIVLIGDDIGLGLSSMAVCFDFCSTHVVQLSNGNAYFYWFQLITKLS